MPKKPVTPAIQAEALPWAKEIPIAVELPRTKRFDPVTVKTLTSAKPPKVVLKRPAVPRKTQGR